jgi:hypothetical protein
MASFFEGISGACLAFARLFAQLAEYHGHVHLGYDQDEPQGPGFRIEVTGQLFVG